MPQVPVLLGTLSEQGRTKLDTIICSVCENAFQVRDESRIMEWTCPVCGGDDYVFPEDDEGYYDEYGESDTDPRLREY